jgi:N-acetylneuraminic acid mutarotase
MTRSTTFRRLPRTLVRLLATAVMAFAGTLVPDSSAVALASVTGVHADWTKRPSLQLARGGHDTATVDGRIFVVGGFQPTDPPGSPAFDSVEARRVGGNGRWRSLAPMPTARANPAAAELDGTVYVVGGARTDETFLDAVERFDPRTGVWTAAPKLPVPRLAAAATGLKGKLYVAGGAVPQGRGDVATASVIVFDPRKQTWKPVAPMLTARYHLRMVAVDGYLYAIGGDDNIADTLSTVERYDPRSDTWVKVASMHETRAVFGATVVKHGSQRFIAAVAGLRTVGGESTSLRSTEVYNLDTGRWQVLKAKLPQGKVSLVSATESDGTVLAIGGGIDVNGTPIGTADVLALALTGRDGEG